MKKIKDSFHLIVFAIVITVSLFAHKDYGISCDEPRNIENGHISYSYILGRSDSLNWWEDREYGIAFELFLTVFTEQVMGLNDSQPIYYARHLLTHLFFLLGAIACFYLVCFTYKNKWLALFGFLLVVMHPRLYGHSFFNSKDIPFMAMFFIVFYLIALAFKKRNLVYFIILGATIGITINIRIMGVMLFAAVVGFLLIDTLQNRGTRNTVNLTAFVATSLFVLYVTWPFLWENPVGNFLYALKSMSNFRENPHVLYMGEFIEAVNIPWHYIPVMFSITTPLVFILIGGIGIFLSLMTLAKIRLTVFENEIERNNLLYVACFFAPVAAVIVLSSVLYDGWRQMFFIYPPFVMLCVYGLKKLLGTKLKKPVTALVLLSFLFLGYKLIQLHPYQQIYFNKSLVITDKPLRHGFDLDYWGTSYKESLEYIVQNDTSSLIKLAVSNLPAQFNLAILPKGERERFEVIGCSRDIHDFDNFDEADYYLTEYRWHPNSYEELEQNTRYDIIVDGNIINTTFKLKD